MRPLTMASAVAAHGLSGAQASLPREPIEAGAFSDLCHATVRQRLEGLLAAAVADGAMPVTPVQRQHVERLEAEAACRVLTLDRALLAVVQDLARSGVETRVLKGPAHAHTAYAQPMLRGYSDVDLLVRSDDLDHAVATLRAMGATRRLAELRPGFDRRFGKGVTLVLPSGIEVDLHRTFAAGPFGMHIDLDSLFEHATPFIMGDRTLYALAREERFLHACFHAALGNVRPRLMALRDVAQMALDADLATARVRRLAAGWRAEPVVARALSLAWRAFRMADVTALSNWAASYEPSRMAQRALASYGHTRRRFAHEALATLREIDGIPAKAAFARALVLPQQEHLRARAEPRLGRVGRAFAMLLWGQGS